MENSAFQEGYRAFKYSKKLKHNPYKLPIMFVFKQEWAKGWMLADRENDLFS